MNACSSKTGETLEELNQKYPGGWPKYRTHELYAWPEILTGSASDYWELGTAGQFAVNYVMVDAVIPLKYLQM